MANRIKTLLKSNKVAKVFNCGQFLSHKMVEILGLHGGYDGVFIDQEHIPSILQRDIEIAAVAAKSWYILNSILKNLIVAAFSRFASTA